MGNIVIDMRSWIYGLNNNSTLYHGVLEAISHFRMKLKVSLLATGCQKLIEVDDEWKLRPFYKKNMDTEVAADVLAEEWKGYVVQISGRNDKQGFPMKQGVLTHGGDACCWVRGIPVTDQGGPERESANLYRVALWMPIWVFSIWYHEKRGEEYSRTHWYYSASLPWSQKS